MRAVSREYHKLKPTAMPIKLPRRKPINVSSSVTPASASKVVWILSMKCPQMIDGEA